jgi:MFS family permease
MHYPRGAWLGSINADQSLGAIVACPVVAWFFNHCGRKKTIAIGYLWAALGVGLQNGPKNEAMFIVGRICLGQVRVWLAVAAPLLTNETAYPTHRRVAGASYNTG